jgi:hypothetical protein
MSQLIRFVGPIEPHEMFRAYKLAWNNTWQMWLRHLFFIAMGSLAVVMGASGYTAFQNGDVDRARSAAIFAALIIAFLVVSAFSLRRRVTRALKASVFNQATGEARIEEQGVIFEDPEAKLQIAWQKLEGFRATDDIVVYYIGYPRTFLAFFRRLAASPDEWNRLLEESDRRLKRL